MIAEMFASLVPAARQRGNASLENPSVSLSDPRAFEELGTSGGKSASGVVVTAEKALNLAGVWQAVTLVSGDCAKLPLYPYRRLPEDDREIDSQHRWYFPVAVRANSVTSAFQFWRTLYVHALLWNNGYGYISRSGELYNLLPDRTAPEWVEVESGRTELVYVTEVDGRLHTLLPQQVFHLRGISIDGRAGYDLIRAAKECWGLAIAQQNFQSKFFKNGARVGGILEVPAAMPKAAKDTVEDGFRKSYEGGDNPFRTVVLREGAKFHAGQVSPQQSELADLTDQSKRDIASIFNIPPSKLGIRDSVSYNSFEQDNLSYLHGCIHHWTCAASDECDMKFLSEQELRNDTHYFEHNYSQFVQADWKTLNEGLEIMRRNEIINADEWRRKLNMNKRPDGKGGEYLNPNTKSAASQVPQTESVPARDKRTAFAGIFQEASGRIARRVAFDARQAIKSPSKFEAWLAGRATDHRKVFDDALRPSVVACVELFGGHADELCRRGEAAMFDQMLVDLDALYKSEQSIENYLTHFERTAPTRVAVAILEDANV